MRVGAFSLSRAPSLPVILASEAAECGLACMAMVARYHGHDVDLSGLRQRYSFSLAGASLRSLIDLADRLNFSSRALRVELSALSKIKLPAIVHWDLNHFVVLREVTRTGIVVHDPGLGARSLTLEEASKHLTGVVLEIVPASHFQPVTARTPISLSSLWSKLHGVRDGALHVLGLSVALQIVALVAPFQLQLIVDEALFHADRELLTVLALGFGALAVMQAGIEALRNWTTRVLGQMVTFQVAGNLVRHLIRLPVSFFEKRSVGDIMSRLGSIQPIQDAITRGLVVALIDGLMALVAAIVMVFYSPVLAFVVVLAVAFNLGLAAALFPTMRARMEEEIVASARAETHLMETVRASTTIKLMGRESEREGAWRNHFADQINAGISVGRHQIALSFAQSVVTGVQTVLVTFLAARMILNGDGFSVGMLYAFLSFRQTFTDRAVSLINQGIQFRLLGLHLDRIADIATATPDAAGEAAPSSSLAGGLRATNLSFRYGAADPLVLEGVEFEAEPGDFVAIVGPSGGGKTTLLKVLLGLYAPTDGAVEIDNLRATPERWRAWRAEIGVVAQDDRLLSGSIADNIAFFDPDLDMGRVQAAAAAARIHDDILRMPMQYLTLIGDMGSTLSGGQRQRILLARALYRRPRILCLDEGTANLDEGTEEEITALIAALPITRIVVAHRPALIRRASKVYGVAGREVRLLRPAPPVAPGTEPAEPLRAVTG